MRSPDTERSTPSTSAVATLGEQPSLVPLSATLAFSTNSYARLASLISKPTFQYVLLALITLLAGALRFYKLGEWSFWGDEMFTVSGREDGFNYNFFRESISLVLIQAVVNARGISEWNARLVPALTGVVSIPVLYFPIKKMFKPAVGLIVVLLLALSPWHLYWSQSARFYVPLLLFYTLALLTFYLGVEEDRPWYLILSLVFLGLATKERLLALFFIPVVASYVVLLQALPFNRPRGLRARNLAIFIIPGLILGLFFVRPYILNLSGWLEGFGYSNNNPFWIIAGVVYYTGLPTVSMAVVGAVYGLARKNRAVLLLTLSAAVPVLAVAIIAPFHYTANRYAFGALTSWLILAGLAVVELFRHMPRNISVLVLGAVLLLLVQPMSENVLYYRYQNGNRDNWKAAFELVKEKKEEGDLVVAINPELSNYYLQERVTVGLRYFDLTSLESSNERVWFIEDMVTEQKFPHVHHWLTNHTQLIGIFDTVVQARNFTMRVYLYDPGTHITETNQSSSIRAKRSMLQPGKVSNEAHSTSKINSIG